ncbi:hypothetical protein Nepgr_028517 [Nepenthes gracilis]|uniref:Uncharacterized protein n=1 Tax=Nepenthes gracilis TaxID=150966 RepID=A0AAD3TD17_NEPGR|nr:hypothetical protein Nepgr_028517 [Nepenthes gracilis]
MKLPRIFSTTPKTAILAISKLSPISRQKVSDFGTYGFNVSLPKISCDAKCSSSSDSSSSPVITSDVGFHDRPSEKLQGAEEGIEKAIFMCRFLTLFGIFGSLIGSILCFIKGCTIVAASFMKYFVSRGNVILLLVEAIDTYLLGTVMLVFGMGLYELFVSNLDIANPAAGEKLPNRSNLLGLFTLTERPRWLEIKSVNELKTKIGHVIVMLLLIGLLDKTKKAAIHSPSDLLCFSASIFLSSLCLYLLSKLNGPE